MKVIVTGGCGHIGSYLIPKLVKAGYDVINITRGHVWRQQMKACSDKIFSEWRF